MTLQSKTQVRKLIRDKRKSLSEQQQARAAEALLVNLCSERVFDHSENIAMYLANDGEIDPIKVMHWCWKNGKITYVPIVAKEGDNILSFAPVNEHTELYKNRYGIEEPKVESILLLKANELDLVLTPLVAFDEAGNRLGMGGGYYDQTFEFLRDSKHRKPELIGVAHALQCLPKLETEPWDIALNNIVTDDTVYSFH